MLCLWGSYIYGKFTPHPRNLPRIGRNLLNSTCMWFPHMYSISPQRINNLQVLPEHIRMLIIFAGNISFNRSREGDRVRFAERQKEYIAGVHISISSINRCTETHLDMALSRNYQLYASLMLTSCLTRDFLAKSNDDFIAASTPPALGLNSHLLSLSELKGSEFWHCSMTGHQVFTASKALILNCFNLKSLSEYRKSIIDYV
jgi:hypothetical protein